VAAGAGGAAMTDRVLVLRRLARLIDALANARQRRPSDVATLRADALLRDALALSVLVAVQEAVDVAFHIVTDEGWGVPASYAEGFELLARHGVLEAEVARAMTGAAGLRNYATRRRERERAARTGSFEQRSLKRPPTPSHRRFPADRQMTSVHHARSSAPPTPHPFPRNRLSPHEAGC
jgi:uncharacterized protein YutE (UPF0331/DUF86 family)